MIATGAGVVDADYRGQLFVLLFNHSDADFKGMCPRVSPTNPYGLRSRGGRPYRTTCLGED